MSPNKRNRSTKEKRAYFDSELLVWMAKRNLDDFILLENAGSNIFGSPEPLIDPDYHIDYEPHFTAMSWFTERNQIVCCMTQQLYAERMGLTEGPC